jgi:hypothetical protein
VVDVVLVLVARGGGIEVMEEEVGRTPVTPTGEISLVGS